MGSEFSNVFARATGAVGKVEERVYRIGGCSFRLRYAGEDLRRRLSPSIEHLASDVTDGDEYVISLWDGAATGTGPPPLPDEAEQLPDTGLVIGGTDGVRLIYEVGLRTLSVIDEAAGNSWYWTADAALLPEWSTSTPIRHILHLALAARGCQVVHAGAAGRADGGVLFAGRSGSGKSTSTLSTLGSSLLYAGDDYVGVGFAAGGKPYVYSLYNCGKLESDHVKRFPGLRYVARPERDGVSRPWREKTMFYVKDTYPDQLTSGFPLKAIVIPRISPDEPSRISELPLATAVRTLVPSTLFEIHGTGQAALTTLVRAAELAATLELRVGYDVDAIPTLIGEALDGLP